MNYSRLWPEIPYIYSTVNLRTVQFIIPHNNRKIVFPDLTVEHHSVFIDMG